MTFNDSTGTFEKRVRTEIQVAEIKILKLSIGYTTKERDCKHMSKICRQNDMKLNGETICLYVPYQTLYRSINCT
jgi:hypothetical protein